MEGLNAVNAEEIAHRLSIEKLVELLQLANEKYNIKEIMRDEVYHILISVLKKRAPEHEFIKELEHPDSNDMASLNKLFDGRGTETTTTYNTFIKKNPGEKVVSDKADGLTMKLIFVDSTLKMVETHTKQVPHGVKYFEKFFNTEKIKNANLKNFAIRGEVIIPRRFQEQINQIKNKEEVNLRHVVSGIMTSKEKEFWRNEMLKYVRFYAFELILKQKTQLKILHQLQLMDKADIKTVYYELWDDMTLQMLNDFLIKRHQESDINIDGIVVTHNATYLRKKGNPDHAIAYKSPDIEPIRDTTVIEVNWNETKSQTYCPVVHFKEIVINGSKVKNATMYNARQAVEMGVGEGAIIQVKLSGTIIPKIVKVLKKMPVKLPKDGIWGPRKTHLYTTENTNEQKILHLINFFKVLQVPKLGKPSIEKLVNAGFDTVQKIATASSADFKTKVEQCGEVTASNRVKDIKKALRNATPVKIMQATDCFSQGRDSVKLAEKKLDKIFKAYPTIITKYVPTLGELVKIKGIAEKTAKKFLKCLPIFRKYLKKNPVLKQYMTNQKQKKIKSIGKQILKGKKVALTGSRKITKQIVAAGGTIVNSISHDTDFLVAKDKTKSSKKIRDAKKFNVAILSMEEMLKMLS